MKNQITNPKELKENKEIQRPNEHQAWYVDSFVIDFLWKKGWNCCKSEACDWWYNINQHLKKELFTNEQEWKDFKENGFYPAKHQTNWAKLKVEGKAEIEKACWDGSRYHQEQLMAYTFGKLKEYEEKKSKNHEE